MLKKIAASVIAVLLAAGGVVPAASCAGDKTGNPKVLGDMNGDGVVNTFDLVMLRQYVSSDDFRWGDGPYNKEYMNMDLDEDGKITEADADGLSDFLIGKPTPFAVKIGSVPLGRDIVIEAEEGKKTDEKFAAPYMNFGLELFQHSAEEKKNTGVLVSPVSVMTALAMTANGADGETLSQMEKVLGGELKMDDINEYLSYFDRSLTSSKVSTLNIANSIWFNKDRPYELKDEFLTTDMKYYNAPMYREYFNDDTIDDINNWVMKNTRSMIKKIIEDSDRAEFKESALCLINTLYFHGDWGQAYEYTAKREFTDVSGNTKEAEFLCGEEYYYYETDKYTGFRKDYAGGEFSFVALLPNEGTDINDFIAGLDPDELVKTISKPIVSTADNEFELHAMIPEFKDDFGISMKDMLCDMGMPLAFNDGLADFTKMADIKGLYITDVIHKTAIDLNKAGTSAAAVTAVVMKENAAITPREIKKIYVDLNRPFVYMIVENDNSLPLFIGSVTEIKNNQ